MGPRRTVRKRVHDARSKRILLILPALFFSRRRRDTRCSRDWSSDVCSSDLTVGRLTSQRDRLILKLAERDERIQEARRRADSDRSDVLAVGEELARIYSDPDELIKRSEERRVGKECRSRGSPYH